MGREKANARLFRSTRSTRSSRSSRRSQESESRSQEGMARGASWSVPRLRGRGSWVVMERGWSDVGMSSGDHFKTFEYRCLQIRQDGQKITAGFSSLAIRLTSYGSHYPHGHAV